MNMISSPSTNVPLKVTTTTVTTPTTITASQHFLARLPRSLSQLNLGSKRKSTNADLQLQQQRPIQSPSSSSSSNTPVSSPIHQVTTKSNQKSSRNQILADSSVPPPLPQRNIPRKSSSGSTSNQISDLDASLMAASKVTQSQAPSTSGGSKKKNKQKAYSDPKMSSEMLLQMEAAHFPPPLPPRSIGGTPTLDVFSVMNKDSFDGTTNLVDGRPLPNSCATQMHYPLIATSVSVRDGLIPPFNFQGYSFDTNSVMNTSSSSLPPELSHAVVSNDDFMLILIFFI